MYKFLIVNKHCQWVFLEMTASFTFKKVSAGGQVWVTTVYLLVFFQVQLLFHWEVGGAYCLFSAANQRIAQTLVPEMITKLE